jgi:glycosyltransferase involved in cell wall biosynthesis
MYEGYGLPVAESVARGLPTIASDIPPHREIGADAVLYFPPGDARALADRIAEARGRYDELAGAALARSAALARTRPTWRDLILEAAGWAPPSDWPGAPAAARGRRPPSS